MAGDAGEDAVALRPLRRADLPLLGRWLADPVVHRWWHHETTPEALERDFGASLDGRDPTELLLASTAGRPYGFVQRYRIEDEPAYVAELAPLVDLPPHALSVDYLLGEPDLRGRGLGTAMVAAAVAEGWRRRPEAEAVVVPVHAENRASWRALERAGFRRVAEGELEPDNPADSRAHVVYRLDRPGRVFSDR